MHPGPGDPQTTAIAGDASGIVLVGAPASSSSPSLATGTIVDGTFCIERRLGAGGMGEVYLARDLRLGRQVALKLHHSAPGAAERMLREAKVLARLSHPNIVTVHEVGTSAGRVFIAMELLEGGTVSEWLAARPRRWPEIVDVYLQAARGLAAAHDAELVHRDVKPDNILLASDGRVRVGDFGLARPASPVRTGAIDAARARDATTLRGDETTASPLTSPGPTSHGAVPPVSDLRAVSVDSPLTTAGQRVGTPAYMSPEALRGDDVDARSDQYAFCLALRQALQTCRRPAWLDRIVARGTAADPAARWPSMHELIARIEGGRRARRRTAALAAAAVVVGVVGAALWQVRAAPDRRCTGAAERLRGVWGRDRAEAVRRALGGDAASTVVVDGLDGYASAWTAMHREACVATRIRGEQSDTVLDQRMICLERGRAQLAATVELLASGDRRIGRRALEVVRALPSVIRCGDVKALGAMAPPPESPVRAAEIAAVQAELGAAHASWHAGRFAQALTASKALLPRARGVGWAPLHAQVAFATGRMIDDSGADGAPQLEESLLAALAGGDDVTAVRAAADLAVTTSAEVHPADADRWLALGHAVLDRMGGDPELELRLTQHESIMQANRWQFDEAEQTQRRALAIAQRLGGDPRITVGDALAQLGVVQTTAGHSERAVGSLRGALALQESVYHPDAPELMPARNALAIAYHDLDRDDLAAPLARRIVDASRRGALEGDAALADDLNNLAAIFIGLGDVAAALEVEHQALDIADHSEPRVEDQRGRILGNLAVTHHASGHAAEAAAYALRSYQTFQRAYPADHGALVNPQVILGTLARERGELEASARYLEAARALAGRALPDDHADRINVDVELAETRIAQRRFTEAVTLAEQAVARLDHPDPSPAHLAQARFVLARALWAAGGDPGRARRLAVAGRDGLAAAGEPFAAQRDEIVAWLAAHP